MKNVILVPKGKSPLDVLAKMGERTKEAWIFIHDDVIERLRELCDDEEYLGNEISRFIWYGKSSLPAPIIVSFTACMFVGPWNTLTCINSMDIEFDNRIDNPKEIIFLKMAD